jgi:hypothetical protein
MADASPSASALIVACDWCPMTSGTIGTPGSTRCRNGSCISSECSRRCTAGSSLTTEHDAMIVSASSADTSMSPSGVSNTPRAAIATPSKPT